MNDNFDDQGKSTLDELRTTRELLEQIDLEFKSVDNSLQESLERRLFSLKVSVGVLIVSAIISLNIGLYSVSLSNRVTQNRNTYAMGICVQSNETKIAIKQSINDVVDALLIGLKVEKDDPEVIAFREDINDSLNKLEEVDCETSIN